MFKRKVKVKFDDKKKEILVAEEMSVESLYDIAEKYRLDKGMEDMIATLQYSENGSEIVLEDGWTFNKKTVSMFNQKVNRRYKKVNRANSNKIISKFVRL